MFPGWIYMREPKNFLGRQRIIQMQSRVLGECAEWSTVAWESLEQGEVGEVFRFYSMGDGKTRTRQRIEVIRFKNLCSGHMMSASVYKFSYLLVQVASLYHSLLICNIRVILVRTT